MVLCFRFCVLCFVFCVLFWRIVVIACLPVMLHTFLVPYPRFGGKHCNCEAKCKVFLRDCASFFWENRRKRAKIGFCGLEKYVGKDYGMWKGGIILRFLFVVFFSTNINVKNMSKIPVFISCPTTLNKKQADLRKYLIEVIEDLNMEPRALGRSDYPKDYPLKEVAIIARRCSGGIILGFEQVRVSSGKIKAGTASESDIKTEMLFPTPWNQIEAGILFGLKLPLLIFKEDGVSGGVFDNGISDAFVHTFPSKLNNVKKDEIKQVIQKWFGQVSVLYNQY